MRVASLGFLVAALVVAAVVPWLPGSRLRRAALALLNAGFLATLLPDLASAAAVAVFLGSGYGVARWLAARPRRAVLGGYVALLVAAFVVLKRYTLVEPLVPSAVLRHGIQVVGLSYMLFRQIHFLVDCMQGQVERASLWTYLNYQLNLFTLVAGPINRYQPFARDWGRLEPVVGSREELIRVYRRILVGFLAMTVLAPLALTAYELAVQQYRWGRPVRLPLAFYGYPAYVYFNFAGYCDVVIGLGALLGYRLPENFDRPYRARNMIDYWNRWHMTLSHWLRDYLFTPLYKSAATRWPRRAKGLAPPIYFVVFLVAGIWHGSTANFAVFGLLNGVGVSVAKAWENWIVARRGRAGLRRYLSSRPVEVAAVALNFHFACATFLFFPAGIGHCLDVLRSLAVGSPVAS